MENAMSLESGTDVLWMLFSLLTLDPVRQVEILGGLPLKEDSDDRALTENAAIYLRGAFETFDGGWLEEFAPCPKAKQFFELTAMLDSRQSYESFMTDDQWPQLRVLAKLVLDEAGLDPLPLPSRIYFQDFMEIVTSEDMAPFVDRAAIESAKLSWIAAAKAFARHPHSNVLCSVCKEGALKAEKIPDSENHIRAQKVFCSSCGMEHVVRSSRRG